MIRDLTNVAAVVVLFNPKDEALANILSFCEQVRWVYVIDNSTSYNQHLIDGMVKLDRLTYINNDGNRGIAHALNNGADRAINDGYSYLLTMDQDTYIPDGFVRSLMEVFTTNTKSDIGVVAPRYLPGVENMAPHEDVLVTMTSGSIMDLAIYRTTGPFIEELFIDHVDHEYCLRLLKNGYRVVQANNIEIIHRPGTLIKMKFLGKKITFSSHSPVRLYYFCRNGFYVSSLYGDLFPMFRKRFRELLGKEILKIPFEKNRISRVKRLAQGYRDYRNGKLGPLTVRSK